MASSAPTAARSATPMTTARPPVRNGPDPRITLWSFLTSWPSGKSEASISSSVTADPPDLVGERDELIGGQCRDRIRVGDALGLPDVDRIRTSAKQLQTFFEARLLGLQRVDAEVAGRTKQLQCGVTKILHGVVDESIGTAEKSPVLATHGAPHQGPVVGVELLDAATGLNDLRTGHGDTTLLGHRQRQSATGDQPATAIASGAAADQSDDLHARAPRFDDRAHDLGNGKFAGVRLLQAYTAGIEQDQHWDRLDVPGGAQEAGQLGAVNLSESTAHEVAFLRRNEYRRTIETAAPHDDSVVELLGKVEHLQMRADFAHLRPDELQEAAGVEQQPDPCSRRRLIPARRPIPSRRQLRRLRGRSTHWSLSSIKRTA